MGYLDKVPEEKVFKIGSKSLSSIKDLLDELKLITDEEYSHYASENHNYFADWIMHVIKYDKLAADLINAGESRKKAISALEKHIKKLNQPVKLKKPPVVKKLVSKEKPVETDPLIAEVLKKPEPVVEEQTVETKEVIEKEPVVNTNHPGHDRSIHEIEEILKNLSKEDVEIRHVIWKHFKWELAKEFMYGMALGILMGFILSKLFIP